jgi:DNA processing protein
MVANNGAPSLFDPEPPRDQSASWPGLLPTVLALSSIRGVGDVTVRRLYDVIQPMGRVWTVEARLLERVLTEARTPAAAGVARTIASEGSRLLEHGTRLAESLGRRNVQFVTDADPQYPTQLRQLARPPRWLFVQGNVELLGRRSSVAVVGTREPSPKGVRDACVISASLVDAGFTIVSGLAEGIDEAAHATAVERGGHTVAVLGNGIDVTFPAGTADLRARILASQGAIVTEYLPRTMYSRHNFVQRNRIQAALASVVVPVECKPKSGTAHTVRFAAELGRLIVGIAGGSEACVLGDEILALLPERRPVIIDLTDHVADLGELLTPFSADAVLPPSDPGARRARRFAGVIEQMEREARRAPISPDDTEWLISLIKQISERTNGVTHAD